MCDQPTGRLDPRLFYDDLAEDYHLVYADWTGSMRRQATALDRVIQDSLGAGPQRILDCTCGIGTQALGLAQLGHEVLGTDLSPRAIERARSEAHRLGLRVRFEVADVRTLGEVVGGEFDVVLSADNSLPHLLSEMDLRRGVRGMLGRVRPGGLFLASTRDYDQILEEKPSSTPVGVTGPEGERRIAFQLWDWLPDGRTYRLELFLLRESGEGWTVRSRRARYRAVTREELAGIVREEGGGAARWLMPAESRFFQPLLVALKRA
jgi:SAM-dependent methyltransferase